MGMLENVFSWSKSRDEQFRECQRKYFYDKYQSWGGWDRRAPSAARMAYILKNLKNRWAWKGETVHHVIETVLKSMRVGQPIAQETALKVLTDTMRADYRNSKARRYLEEPKKTVGLFEHEYDKPIDDVTWKKIHATSAECLTNFYQSALFKELQSDNPANWLVIEDLEEFQVAGVKVYVKLDFARKKGDVVEIYDWKTGKAQETGSDIQIGTYVLYAMQKWGVGLDKIRAFIVNLSAPNVQPDSRPLSPELLQTTQDFIAQSVQGMQLLLEDPKKNIPKPSPAFAYAANLSVCQLCNFYKICEKYNAIAS